MSSSIFPERQSCLKGEEKWEVFLSFDLKGNRKSIVFVVIQARFQILRNYWFASYEVLSRLLKLLLTMRVIVKTDDVVAMKAE